MCEAARWNDAGPVTKLGSLSSAKPIAESASWK